MRAMAQVVSRRLSPRRLGFAPTAILSVVVKVELGKVFIRVFRVSPVNAIPP
jgi:hypothetical protein